MARRLQVVEEAPYDLTTMDTEFLWCRTERHKWEWERDQIVDVENDKAFDRLDVCERCGSVLVKTISTTTFRVIGKPRRTYPKGYLIKGSGRIPLSDVYRVQYDRRRPRR